jgi:Outer membrane protein and related peptidoglycan-associated (lipo)proteins
MRIGIFILGFTILYHGAAAQLSDTLIYAEGKIINATTREQVSAKISYQSLPYGNTVGFLSGSSFLFPLFNGEKYSITIEAPGYAPAKYMLDPAEANGSRRVIRDIELQLPATAAQSAASTHTPGKVMRLDNLIFDVGTSRISAASYSELDEVVLMLKDNPSMIIQLEGHTDTKGDPKLNMKLSQDRVTAVKAYLVSKGSNKNRIKTKAFGGTLPVTREDTEEARKLNRRVELRVLEN